MFVEKTFTSWNSSTGNCTSGIIHVEIITLVLYFGADQGALFYVQPAYEDALTDTGRAFPCLAVRQNIIYLPDKSIDKCTDLIPLTPDILAQYYYRHSDRWDAANVTTFLTNTADCFSQQNGIFATNAQKLFISVGVPFDFQSKSKWPTRIVMGARATGARTLAPSAVSLLKFHNWTTVVLVCDGPGNGPISCNFAKTLKQDLESFATKVEVVVFDGFSPSFNYVAALAVLSQKARVVIYSGLMESTWRNILINANALNMTNGEYAHILYANFARDFTWKWNNSDDQVVEQAYKSVILVEQDASRDAPPKGTPYYTIKERWLRRSQELFNFTYSLRDPNPHLFAAYDMVLMIAEVTKDLIAANKSSLLGSGRKFYEQFLNRTFYTKTGTNYIDSAGVIGGLSKVITQYKPNSTDKMIKYYMEGLDFTMREVAPISWPAATWPVPNRPRCGFTGLDPVCLPPKNTEQQQAAIGGSICCIAVVLAISFIIWWRLRTADMATWWILDEEYLGADLIDTSRVNLQEALRL